MVDDYRYVMTMIIIYDWQTYQDNRYSSRGRLQMYKSPVRGLSQRQSLLWTHNSFRTPPGAILVAKFFPPFLKILLG